MAVVGTDLSYVILTHTFHSSAFNRFYPLPSRRHNYIFLQLYFLLRHPYNHSNLSFHSTLLLLNSKLSMSTHVWQEM